MGGERPQHQKQNPLQLLLSIFADTAPATGDLVSTQQPADSTAKPSVVSPPSEDLKTAVLKRSGEVEDVLENTKGDYGPKR